MNMRQLKRRKYRGQFTRPSDVWRVRTAEEIRQDICAGIEMLRGFRGGPPVTRDPNEQTWGVLRDPSPVARLTGI